MFFVLWTKGGSLCNIQNTFAVQRRLRNAVKHVTRSSASNVASFGYVLNFFSRNVVEI